MAETTDAPIMVRVDVTRDELHQVKVLALIDNKSPRQWLGDVIRRAIKDATT